MDEFLQMTPGIKKDTQIDQGLALVLNEDRFHFPESDVEAARILMDRWEGENWGANEVQGDEDAEEDGAEEAETRPRMVNLHQSAAESRALREQRTMRTAPTHV